MRLLQADFTRVGPFEEVSLSLGDGEGGARAATVIHGAGGLGKTSLLSAIACTRPGAVTSVLNGPFHRGHSDEAPGGAPSVTAYWLLGQDDLERQHPLCLASPNARVQPEDDREALRRREQAVFERVAKEGGFAYLAIPSNRWFSSQPIAINAPLRSVARYDVRGSFSLDDRMDLARDTKQALAYAAIGAALKRTGSSSRYDLSVLDAAQRHAVDVLLKGMGFSYVGLDNVSFEPLFNVHSGSVVVFDALPTSARHLVSFAALAVRTLWGAYPGLDPRSAEGVVTIDEPDLHQPPSVQAELMSALGQALPRVQWIVTTTSLAVAGSVDSAAVIALRRARAESRVELFSGVEARTH